ncbi:MAG: Pr6Pr family membrane protein [Oscillospiraceae bacterium]|jgi:hypothetical protein|nr:Pr6Pr family membrane protein [Oscillospiraceae bacterium]
MRANARIPKKPAAPPPVGGWRAQKSRKQRRTLSCRDAASRGGVVRPTGVRNQQEVWRILPAPIVNDEDSVPERFDPVKSAAAMSAGNRQIHGNEGKAMYIKSRVVSLVYKMAAMAVCLAGVLLIFGFPNTLSLSTIKYYTVQSNFLCLAFLTVSAIQTIIQMKRSGLYGAVTYMPHCKGAVIIAITLTLLVYQFMLADTPFSMTEGGAGNFFVHFLTPVLMIFDWLLFDEKGHYHVLDPFRWTVIPLCYLAYAMIAAPLGVTYIGGSRYPYFFVDIDAIGVGGVTRYVLMITVAFLVLGYLIFGLDKWMGHHTKTADATKARRDIRGMGRSL